MARPASKLRVPQRPDGTEPSIHGATIALVQSSSLPMLVQQELERMILAGEVAPGAKLNEAAIADRLGVSRGPVREAFRALEESGLVRLEKNRGVFVRQISVAEADEIYEVRALLDEWAGRALAQSVSRDQLQELEGLVDHMDAAAAGADVDLYYHLNLDFHDRLVASAGNGKLLETYRRLVRELSLFRRASLAQDGNMPLSTREHRGIVERIANGDGDGAGAALRAHAMASRERMHRARGAGGKETIATRQCVVAVDPAADLKSNLAANPVAHPATHSTTIAARRPR